VSAGSLPSGLTLGANGVVSGTPAAAGSFSFTARVGAGDGRSAAKQFDLLVAERLTANAPADQPWEVGRPLQISINARGGTPGYSWKLSGALPLKTGFIGDKDNGSTSFLQGVPAEAGTFPIVLTVTDAAGASTQVTVTLTVAPKLQITTFAVGRARVGKRYLLAFASRGGVGETTWTLATGSLPSGMKLNGTTGVVSGKARRRGRFRFTVLVTDSLGAKAAMTYTLTVTRQPPDTSAARPRCRKSKPCRGETVAQTTQPARSSCRRFRHSTRDRLRSSPFRHRTVGERKVLVVVPVNVPPPRSRATGWAIHLKLFEVLLRARSTKFAAPRSFPAVPAPPAAPRVPGSSGSPDREVGRAGDRFAPWPS
jgi:hypothetical protein